MWDMCSTVHDLPLEPWKRHALQDDRNLSNLRKDQERLSNLFARLGVRTTYASARHGLGAAERSTDERREQGVLRTEYGGQGMSRVEIQGVSELITLILPAGGQQIGAGFNAGKFGGEGYAEAAGTNRSVLQTKQTTHLLVLCERRVQSRSPVSVQVSTSCSSVVGQPNAAIRHEKPTDSALAKQNIQDRYHGRSDPVAQKIMAKHAESQGLKPPEDTSIVSDYSIKHTGANSQYLRCRCSCHRYPQKPPNSLYVLWSSSHCLP